MEPTDYVPIDCSLYSEYELARISHSFSHYPDFGQDVERKPDESLRTG